jgi:tetratricopeptide (TPR) repeat protein
MMKTFRALLIAACVVSLHVSPAGSQTSGRIQAEKLFVEAQKALSRGDDETAETLLMKSLQKDAAFTSAIWQLAQIYEKRDKLEYARELILRGLQQEPHAAWAREKLAQLEKALTRKLLAEAERYMSAGEYDLAIPKLSLYLGISPYDPLPLVQLGRCHLALGNLDTAKEYLNQALERDPSNAQIIALAENVDKRLERSSVDALVAKAQSILADYTPDRREEARGVLIKILERDPGNAYALGKLEELDALSADKSGTDNSEDAVEKGLEAVSALGGPLARVKDFIVGKLLAVILVAAVVLLAVNINRKKRRRYYPLQGNMSLIPILDIVSLINGNLKTGRLAVELGEQRGEIFFEKGEIVHARLKGMDGKKAFHKIMGFRSGRFYFKNHLPNVRHSISEPLSLLLLSMKSSERKSSRTKSDSDHEKLFSPVS